jgi:hypothetical protein
MLMSYVIISPKLIINVRFVNFVTNNIVHDADSYVIISPKLISKARFVNFVTNNIVHDADELREHLYSNHKRGKL